MTRPQSGAPPKNDTALHSPAREPEPQIQGTDNDQAYSRPTTGPQSRLAANTSRLLLTAWCRFPWTVIGCATIASGDLVVDDVLICAIDNAVFASLRRPAVMTENDWGEAGERGRRVGARG